MSKKLTIKIHNWDKYNVRTGGIKRPFWFSLSNTLVEDTDFYDFNPIEFKTWIYILSQASKKQSDEIEINLDHAKNVSRISHKEFNSTLAKLERLKCVTVRAPYATRTQAEPHITIQDNTEQDRTNNIAQSKLRESDFEAVYKLYPRKLGRAEGLRRIQATIKTKEELDQFETAVKRYAVHCKEKQTEEKFIKHFSSFVTSWRDWLDPETGTATVTKKHYAAERDVDHNAELEAAWKA